jgi:hypothetical protein
VSVHGVFLQTPIRLSRVRIDTDATIAPFDVITSEIDALEAITLGAMGTLLYAEVTGAYSAPALDAISAFGPVAGAYLLRYFGVDEELYSARGYHGASIDALGYDAFISLTSAGRPIRALHFTGSYDAGDADLRAAFVSVSYGKWRAFDPNAGIIRITAYPNPQNTILLRWRLLYDYIPAYCDAPGFTVSNIGGSA